MVSETVVILNKTGLHARPANLFVKTAQGFQSKVEIEKGSDTHNGKSILSVLGLCATQGTTINIVTEGVDEKEALKALVDLVNSNLGETDESI